MASYDDTATVSGSVAYFSDGADEVPCKSVKTMLPASLDGYASAMETQTGANIWNELWEVGSLTSSGADYPSTTRIRSIGYTTVKGGVTCYINSAGYTADIHFYKDDYTHISYVQKTNTTFSIPSDAKYIRFCMAVAYGTTYNNNILICYGSTAHAYEPYQTPTVYSANLGRTVHGAEVDLVNGEGESLCGKIVFDGSESRWSAYTTGNGYAIPLTGMKRGTWYTSPLALSYPLPKAPNNDNLGVRIGVNNDGIYVVQANTIEGVTDLASFKAWLSENPLTIIYPLDVTEDFTFDGQEIPTRKGYNAFWSEQGDSEVTYYKDGYGTTSVAIHKETPDGEPVEETRKLHRIIYEGQVDVISGTGLIYRGESGTQYDPPEQISFTPIEVSTDEGENTLFANEGASAITYRKETE